MKVARIGIPILSGVILIAGIRPAAAAQDRLEFTRPFAPSEGMVSEVEKPLRDEICLNGSWQFQPVVVPADFKRGSGAPPELPPVVKDNWEKTPIKIPSPWNVNCWGNGPHAGVGTANPFSVDSIYYPSYPPSWNGVEMG